jgi:ribonuclease-3
MLKNFYNKTDISELEIKLSYEFKDKSLLYEALTHPSITKYSKNQSSYQRLEFLGNSILGAVIAQMLYHIFPNANEGHLSIVHSKMSSTEGIVDATNELNIGKYIIIDPGEEKNNGRNNPRNLEDCVEAIIGAIFIDSCYDQAEQMIKKFWLKKITNSKNLHLRDPKSRLQEFCQKNSNSIPQYETILQCGPYLTPTFTIECKINVSGSEKIVTGEGKNKKDAEQNAASEMLKMIDHLNL